LEFVTNRSNVAPQSRDFGTSRLDGGEGLLPSTAARCGLVFEDIVRHHGSISAANLSLTAV
jgi:hypothetical protein